MNGSGVWIAVQRNVTVPARFMESTSVDCRLPDRSFLSESGVAGHTTWEIKVSNDKVHFSNSVRITVFDSSCELCSVADDRPNCTIQERRCLIDGECFVEAETHPSDFCLACVVGRSTQHWSPNPGNRAPQLVDTPPEVTVFSGQSFRLNLVGADPDGTQSFFRLAMATANVSLSHDGQLSGQLYTSRNSSRQLDVVLFDECDRETNVRLEVTVLACPCLNGGTCETWSTPEAPVYDAVYCTCLRDFTGRRCEVLVNPCYSNPCFNGRCIAQSSGIFHCACPEDTTGSRCELPVDPCLPNPCAHGECVPDGQSMQCFCDPGFTGNRAPQLVDTPPEVTVFSGQSFRLNLVGADPDGTQSFFRLAMATANVSLSHDGQLSGQLYTSRNSSRQLDVVLFDECDRETNVRLEVTVLACPCLNGGTCETWSTPEAPVYDAVYCTCLRDFTGRRCEVLVNPCYSNPCFNGRCIAQSSGIFHCACPEDTTGSRCELPVDPCLPNPCAHGECVPDGQSMQCFCDPGFTGERCEIAANPCIPNPCQNGGQCQLTGPVYFRCHCDWGFTGLHCQNLIDPCTDRRCFTHVPCSAVGRTYTCGPCPPGYMGDGTVCEAIPVPSSQYHAGSALLEGGSDNTLGFFSNGSSAGFVQTIPSAEITASYFSSSISSSGVQPPYMSPGFLGELAPSFIGGFPPFSSSLASGFSQVERFSLFFGGPAAYGTPIVSQGFFTHGAQGFVQGFPPPTDMAPIYMTGFTAFDTASSFVPAIAAPELSASYYVGVPFQVTPENVEPTDFSVEFPGTYYAWDMIAAETIYVPDGPQAEGRVISDGFTNPTTAESSIAQVEPTPTMVGFQTDAGSSFESTQFLSDAASNYIPSGLLDDVDDIPDSFLAESTMPSTTEYGLKGSGVGGSNEANQERFPESSADCILRDLLKGLVDSIPEHANATSNDIQEVSTPEVETPQQPNSNAGYPDGNTGQQRAKCAPFPSGDPGNGAEDSDQKLNGELNFL
ncbi:von Willebrand factor D and EGF domain-containing protein [Ixodes scapularis]